MKLKITYHRNGTETYEIDGKPATKEEADFVFPAKPIAVPLPAQTSSCWPMKSEWARRLKPAWC
jgi:hypothetical protein